MGRPKGAKNKTEQELAFIIAVERALKAGGFKDGLVNLMCRHLTGDNPAAAVNLMQRMLDMKFGKPKERLEHSGTDGQPIAFTVSLIKPEDD